MQFIEYRFNREIQTQYNGLQALLEFCYIDIQFSQLQKTGIILVSSISIVSKLKWPKLRFM